MYWILAILTMTIGGSIYVLLRSDSMLMFSWLDAIGIGAGVAHLREGVAPFAGLLPDWIKLSLPQSLWLVSGCLAVHAIWRDPRSGQQKGWMIVVLLLALSIELSQSVGLVPGVFDPVDVLLIIIGFLAAQVAFAIGGMSPNTGASL